MMTRSYQFFSCSELKLVLRRKRPGEFISLFFGTLLKADTKMQLHGLGTFFSSNRSKGWNPSFLCLPCGKRPQHISAEQHSVYTFLGKWVSFSSLNNLWCFLESKGSRVCSEQLKKPEAYTYFWTEVFQLTSSWRFPKSTRRSNPKIGFVWCIIVRKAVAASPQVEPE